MYHGESRHPYFTHATHEYGCHIQEYHIWPVTALLLYAISNSLTVALQLANEQAQSLEASLAAEERIQALEQRLASQQQGSTADQTAAGDPPAMAAPGQPHTLATYAGWSHHHCHSWQSCCVVRPLTFELAPLSALLGPFGVMLGPLWYCIRPSRCVLRALWSARVGTNGWSSATQA